MAVFARPSAAINNARARTTSRCGADCDRATDSRTSRCPADTQQRRNRWPHAAQSYQANHQLITGHTTSTVVGDLSAEIRRSAWRVDTGYTNPVEELSEALAEQGAEWPLLKAGLFGGSVERANEALSIYAETFANRARETSLPLERTSTTFTCREAAQRAHLPRRAVKGLSLVLFEPRSRRRAAERRPIESGTPAEVIKWSSGSTAAGRRWGSPRLSRCGTTGARRAGRLAGGWIRTGVAPLRARCPNDRRCVLLEISVQQ